MNLLELFLIAVGLAADAFAVSVCKGMAEKKFKVGYAAVVGLYFGGFQALMPVLGYFAGTAFERYITAFDHWVAFGLLSLIGFNMIRESFSGKDENCSAAGLGVKTMLVLALATSIDAAAVGVTFAFMKVNIFIAALIIGLVTFAACFIAVKIGTVCGGKLNKAATVIGGCVLIAIGIKILIEHLLA